MKKLDHSFRIDSWKQLLGSGGQLRLSMASEDMAPAVKSGDVLEFEEARLMQISRGDLVLLYSGGELRLRRVLKRLIGESGEQFLLGRDAVKSEAKQYSFSEILAKVISIERNGEKLRPNRDSIFLAKLRRIIREKWRDLYNRWQLRR